MVGSSENGFRASVFLAASATGEKLKPFVVFGGVPGCAVDSEVKQQSFHQDRAWFTVQENAYCDERVMKEWIDEVCIPLILWQ